MPHRTLTHCAGALAVALAVAIHVNSARAITVTSPGTRTVTQRNDLNRATLEISGTYVEAATQIEARAVPRAGYSGTATEWQVIDASPAGGNYSGTLNATGGWYDVEVRAVSGGTPLGNATVNRIGVGEVFITAGQSNSANHGAEGPESPTDDRVSAYNPATGWQVANDPQPVATGGGGSPWPSLGDQMTAKYDVPVGFYSVGWGGTSVAQWVPGAPGPDTDPLYDRLQDAINYLGTDGMRAILWHQGESDNGSNTSTANYASRLQSVIDQSRIDAGFDVPWLVALVSYIPPSNFDSNIISGQQLVIANDPFTYLGPDTDTLTGSPWRDGGGSGIHFSSIGLAEHARLWLEAIDNANIVLNVPEPNTCGLITALLLMHAPLRRRRHGRAGPS
ncbi:MAG: hypothetical protein KDA42_07145 [Planctomycetales bacterium]|nr:hypothetical protein [Planctomycetales bacterium]